MKVDITRQNLASTLLLFAALCLVLWHRYAAAPIEALPGTALRMPLGGLLIVIFTGWVFSPEKLRNELTNNLTVNQWSYPAIRLLIRFVVPVVITLLFLTQIGIL